ncbi:MAG TPA: CZB domain-containing protein [Candidatus Limnocylindrales bacterium]
MAAITGANLKEQLQKAITAHGVFKVRLGQMVEAGTGEMTAAVAAADNKCPLGEWLYTGIDASARSTPQYQNVKELHATFHHAAGEIVNLSAAHKRGEALAAMEMGSTFKQASAKLVVALSGWADSL